MSKPKSIYISIDTEGISGIFEGRQTGGDSGEYQRERKLMIGDINAAVEGALEAGVEEIVVSDAHGGGRNLIAEEVNDAAYLIQGRPTWDTMMKGIGAEYDAVLYLGYHAMKGTKEATLAHTVSGGVVDDVWVNGRATGEFGLNAAVAGQHGVPSVFISGDAAAVEEARQFVPNIGSAVVKWAVGRQVAKRVALGLARTGSYSGNGSGDFTIAFTTGKKTLDELREMASARRQSFSSDSFLSLVYRATVEATEEAIINALFKAETLTGREGNTRYELPYDPVAEILERHGRSLIK